MFKKLLIGTVATLVIVLGVAAAVVALQPAEFRIERTGTINAPAEVVFAQVNDFHNWDAWSPWAKLDPNATNTFEGPSAGKGAVFAWSGKDKVGEGRMTITESRPHELIRINLAFKRPFESACTVEFTFQSAGGQTNVTWVMHGQNDFMGKAVGLCMNMDQCVGGDFEKGLANLKARAEAKK